jgi:hypothetical protein
MEAENAQKAADVLHKFLINPKFAKQILQHDFESQKDFYHYMRKLGKLKLPSTLPEDRS